MAHCHAIDMDRNGRTVNRNDVRLWRDYPAKVYVVRAGNRLALPWRIDGAKGQIRSGVVHGNCGSAEIDSETSRIGDNSVELVRSVPQCHAAGTGQLVG